jgi:ArsR family metal-binding transcriptional regulator
MFHVKHPDGMYRRSRVESSGLNRKKEETKTIRIFKRGMMTEYSIQELEDALRAVKSITAKCEKALPGQKDGSPQKTLLTRRIKAMRIYEYLIEKRMEGESNGEETP